MRILIVEDEITLAALFAEALGAEGHDVMVAHDGEEALVLLEQQPPDACFLDVRLGELSGSDVLRKMRRAHLGIPVVLITGHATPEQIGEASELGVTDIITKPFVLKGLAGILERLSRRE